MKFYWISFITLLFFYLLFSSIWIVVKETMPPPPKIAYTLSAMVILAIFSLIVAHHEIRKWWKGILFWLVSLSLWMIVVDSFIGLCFHADVFYMSYGTWPDKQLLKFVQNGHIYTVFKIIVFIISLSLLRNFYYKKLK